VDLSLSLLVAVALALNKKKRAFPHMSLEGTLNTRCKRRPALHPPPATRPAAISTTPPQIKKYGMDALPSPATLSILL
jgi:hypothetical protein